MTLSNFEMHPKINLAPFTEEDKTIHFLLRVYCKGRRVWKFWKFSKPVLSQGFALMSIILTGLELSGSPEASCVNIYQRRAEMQKWRGLVEALKQDHWPRQCRGQCSQGMVGVSHFSPCLKWFSPSMLFCGRTGRSVASDQKSLL